MTQTRRKTTKEMQTEAQTKRLGTKVLTARGILHELSSFSKSLRARNRPELDSTIKAISAEIDYLIHEYEHYQIAAAELFLDNGPGAQYDHNWAQVSEYETKDHE